MLENQDFYIPESHLNILHLVSAVAWADGDLSKDETEILMELFKADLPVDPQPIVYLDDNMTLYNSMTVNTEVYEQIQERMKAELTFKEILNSYKNNPISLEDLISPIETLEDRCLALKLAYMVVKASPDSEGNLISSQEKVVYRQLISLLNLDNELIKKIEWEADQELEKFQHPFKAFINNVKNFLLKKID